MTTTQTRIDLTAKLGPLVLKNPVTVASGTYGYGTEYADFYDPALLGAIFLKGLTLEEREGNRPQRLVETPSGLLNAIGLQNVGYERFVREKLPRLREIKTAIIANVCGSTIDDYVELTRRLADIPELAAAELNISCPNVRHGGMAFGCVPQSTEEITAAVRAVWPKPLIVKLSPNVTDITATAKAAEAGGADALAVANTFVGMAINIQSRRPKLGNVTGGLSGPAVKPMALRMVMQCRRAVRVPIIGQGGITTWEDAAEFLIAGASALSVGTANFTNPTAPIDILDGLRTWLESEGLKSLDEVVGTLRLD
jgi:dihydroorotate dehydrogenase (NAD+) catalytic subunit